MSKLKETIRPKNIEVGFLYFYVHLITEVVCFYVLTKQVGDSFFLWFVPLLYDGLAFVPQSLIGYLSDKFPKLKFGIIGTILLIISLSMIQANVGRYLPIIILCIGNAFLHVNGAEVTLRASKGKMFHSSLFVAGGSFGVVIGKILGMINVSNYLILVVALTMIPFILLAEYYRFDKSGKEIRIDNYDYHNKEISPYLVILLAVFVVCVRSYMGYGIPTSWNKTTFETILLYSTMGLGKALGGLLVDSIGIRKTAKISILGALPFLIFGDEIMFLSLIGVMLFSMTMAITLGILVSILKETPGLAFGLTTIGLFLGTVPIFFFRFSSTLSNSIIITILTIISMFVMTIILRKDEAKC